MGKTMGTEMANTVRVSRLTSAHILTSTFHHELANQLFLRTSGGLGSYICGLVPFRILRNATASASKMKLLSRTSSAVTRALISGGDTGSAGRVTTINGSRKASLIFPAFCAVQYRESMKTALGEWRKEKEKIRNKDAYGHARGALGPIWMGQRIRSSITDPGAYQDLIYSRARTSCRDVAHAADEFTRAGPGSCVQRNDAGLLQNVSDNKAASTEDFKAIVEKHMTHGMDLDGNHKMDWFFNQYVYGMGECTVHISCVGAESAADGKTHIKGEITRTGVPDTWKDAISLYAHIGDKTVKMGLLPVTHASEP